MEPWRGDYDRLTWLRWASFYVYLATIHAVLRVCEREREEALPPTPIS